jgi:hypothetical protein
MTDDDERVSLDPLKPTQALKALLSVDPDDGQSDEPGSESWARANIHWQHKGQGHDGWVWIAQIRVDGLIFEGRATGPSKPDQAHAAPLKRRAEDAAVSDYLDFTRRATTDAR